MGQSKRVELNHRTLSLDAITSSATLTHMSGLLAPPRPYYHHTNHNSSASCFNHQLCSGVLFRLFPVDRGLSHPPRPVFARTPRPLPSRLGMFFSVMYLFTSRVWMWMVSWLLPWFIPIRGITLRTYFRSVGCSLIPFVATPITL